MPGANSTASRTRKPVVRLKQNVNRRHRRGSATHHASQVAEAATSADRLTTERTVNRSAGPALPCYVTAEQARAMIDAARTTAHRLLLETLWQSGGRITEVLRLRPCDLDPTEGALRMVNEKQRSTLTRSKQVYVSSTLIADLQRLAADNRIPLNGYLFRSQQHSGPVSRQYAWKLINAYALAADVLVQTADGRLRPAHARDFRHGAAVNQIRQGVPLTEVQQQLGHTSVSSTAIYTKLANPERRAIADRVQW